MSDKEKLLELFHSGKLINPLNGNLNFIDLARSLAVIGGSNRFKPTPAIEDLLKKIGPSGKYIFVLIDGMGAKQLEMLPDDSFLKSHQKCSLQSVFLSTTASALTSLVTGLWPGNHAASGWFMYLPERDMSVLPLPFEDRFTKKSLSDANIEPVEIFPAPSFWPEMKRNQLIISIDSLIGSTFSLYSYGDARQVGYKELSDIENVLQDNLAMENGPDFIYLYIPHLDFVGHMNGAAHAQTEKMLVKLDRTMERLAEIISGQAKMIISADHGLIDSPKDVRYLISPDDPIFEHLLCYPTGDGRSPIFHVKPGETNEFISAFDEIYGKEFLLIKSKEAEELPLFGPDGMSVPMRSRIGDFIGIAKGNATINGAPPGKKTPHEVICFHGGLSPDEMNIPLIVV